MKPGDAGHLQCPDVGCAGCSFDLLLSGLCCCCCFFTTSRAASTYHAMSDVACWYSRYTAVGARCEARRSLSITDATTSVVYYWHCYIRWCLLCVLPVFCGNRHMIPYHIVCVDPFSQSLCVVLFPLNTPSVRACASPKQVRQVL